MVDTPTALIPRAGVRPTDPRLALIAERLRAEYGAERVILFGSVARDEACEGSDVDLLVIAGTEQQSVDRRATVLDVIGDVRHGMALAPIVMTPDEVRQRLEMGDQFVDEIVRHGLDLIDAREQLMNPSNPPSAAYIEEWRQHARADWRRMRIMLDAGEPLGAGQFPQQALEKFLKAFLLGHGWRLARTHDLEALLGEAATRISDLSRYQPLCVRVTDYYVQDRYPGSTGSTPSVAQVQADAREAAALIGQLFTGETLAVF